jgi:hypothetical protein
LSCAVSNLRNRFCDSSVFETVAAVAALAVELVADWTVVM